MENTCKHPHHLFPDGLLFAVPSDSHAIRVLTVQPTLAKYRVPVYRELASRAGIESTLWYGDHHTLKNAEPEGFQAELKPLRSWSLAGQELLWHQAQLDAVRRDDIDVVLLSWGTRYLSLGPALRTARRRGLPVVLWGHGYSKNESSLRRWARDRMARLASVLMFYDEATAAAAVESGWPADRVFVAPNAIDQEPIAKARKACLADAEGLKTFRSDQGLEGKSLFLFVSRFTPENRIDLLIEAIDDLRRRRPDAVAVLIGGGQEFDRIESQVAEKNLQDHVRLLGPIYEESQLAPWFVTAEAFVYPSAIGLSLLHAFGYGLPVVTDNSSSGHNPEIIAFNPEEGPRQNGLAYRANDPQDFAATLERLLDDASLQSKLSENALLTVEERYNVPAMVDGMEAAIRRGYELRRE